ncbi:Hint domain-containing protein [Nonomuraea sp. AD125B]|uniref:Hint domain-containing protein n=2 Tax=Nonomuraea TaxID=83681 RepID=UPI0035274A23
MTPSPLQKLAECQGPAEVGLEEGAEATAALGRACSRPKRANSFVPGTHVVMADGSTKPIEKVRVGDEVLAADPRTGERGVRRVQAVIVGDGAKNLVKVSVDTDGDLSTVEGTVEATAELAAHQRPDPRQGRRRHQAHGG